MLDLDSFLEILILGRCPVYLVENLQNNSNDINSD